MKNIVLPITNTYICKIFNNLFFKPLNNTRYIYCLFVSCLFLALLSCQSKKNDTKTSTAKDKTNNTRINLDSIPELTEENHNDVMDMIFGKPKHNITDIGVLVYNGTNTLDVLGPRHVLGQILTADTKLIGIKPGNFKTTSGVEIVPDTVIDSVQQLDILVIPGGFKGTIKNVYNKKLHDWIKKIDSNSVYTTSVCTGAWVLGATGLLKGKKATTHWYRAEEMLEKYGAEYVNERYVQDGKYWSSAGVTAGMDMSLAIINDILGENYTEGVMLDMEYDPKPPIEGGTPEKSSFMMKYLMKDMYDAGVEPLVDSLEQALKNTKTSL